MRALLATIIGLAAVSGSQVPLLHRIAGTGSMNETLRAAASRIPHFMIGSQNNVHHIGVDANYTRTLRKQYEATVTENSCKWGGTEPAQGRFNFSVCAADQAAVVDSYGMKFRLHNLCWGMYNPGWLTGGGFSSSQLQGFLSGHIDAAIEAVGPKAFVVDVVNEPFCDNAGECDPTGGVFKAADPWYPKLSDYVADAFKAARAAADKHAPALKLFVNDYSILNSDFKAGRVVQGIKQLRAAGAPIDGLGVQAHMGTSAANGAKWKARMQSLRELGLMLQITEMDAECGDPCNGDKAEKQAQVFGDVLTACLATLPDSDDGPGCGAHLTWGFTDRYSWLNKPGHITNPLPFDANYNPKPAALEMLSVLQHWSAGIRDPTRPWAYQSA